VARAFILSVASGLVLVLVLASSAADSSLGWALPPALRAPGAVALAGGVALVAWAEVALLRTARSTGGFGDAPDVLVARGPYRYGRNPIYLGAFFVLIGLAGWRGSPSLLLAGAAFLPLMHVFVIRVEEPATRRRLGAAYDTYSARVPRWLPRRRQS
jgi:protein-S-isoprenylcysteine O-methyltransferase Ste14